MRTLGIMYKDAYPRFSAHEGETWTSAYAIQKQAVVVDSDEGTESKNLLVPAFRIWTSVWREEALHQSQ